MHITNMQNWYIAWMPVTKKTLFGGFELHCTYLICMCDSVIRMINTEENDVRKVMAAQLRCAAITPYHTILLQFSPRLA
jgi:hypothetical protein